MFKLSTFQLLLLVCLTAGAGFGVKVKLYKMEQVFENLMALLLDQKTVDVNETPPEFRRYAIEDYSNEETGRLSTQDMISRSGYNYELHYVASPDGYITQLIRIINPLADPSQLKQPPVVMFHGGLIDTHCWVWASSIQHHPEKYPRTLAEDGPITSWNRSLALVLSNNGYDVWLAGTRGANPDNKGHLKYTSQFNSWLSRNETDYLAVDEDDYKRQAAREKDVLAELLRYWDYSMDELSQLEQPKQIDTVLEITGAKNVTVINYSLSSLTNLATFAAKPEYVRKLHNFVTFAPIINNIGTNRAMKIVHSTVCKHGPEPLGTLLFTEFFLSDLMRRGIQGINLSRNGRYIYTKAVVRVLAGPSAKYRTLLDQHVVANVFKQLGFKEAKHYCQQIEAGRLQKFDYGPVKNKQVYGSLSPPVYDVSSIKLDNWFLISSGNDVLATPESIKEMLRLIKKKPFEHVYLPHFNHLDLTAGFENDRLINLPVLRYMDHYQLPPMGREFAARRNAIHRDYKDLEKMIPRAKQTKDAFGIIEGHLRRADGADGDATGRGHNYDHGHGHGRGHGAAFLDEELDR